MTSVCLNIAHYGAQSSNVSRHQALGSKSCYALVLTENTLTRLSLSTNLVIILGMMQLSKKIPFDDPQVLMYVRILYVATNIIIAGVYLYLQQQINKKKGRLSYGVLNSQAPR